MQRRDLLKLAALTAGAAAAQQALPGTLAPPDTPNSAVRRVLVVFKCHLDVGFTDTQAAVMRKYFDVYYPQAIETCAALRRAGGDRYTWTTGSWLLYEYLEQATAEQHRAMEQAIAVGDISWHALPFSWQTEMLDRSMIEGALGLSRSLDARFGHNTIAAKMSDVPGHTRGIIAPLAAAGISLLDIGVNGASTPPQVPDIFLWKAPDGSTLPMIYHHHDYGGTVVLPGTDTAFSMEMRGDNAGPHTQDEIRAIYTRLRQQFPGANVTAATLNDVAAALAPARDRLPVVTGEIGDTWIYGIPSDPPKVARYREAARMRQEWIAQKKLEIGGDIDCALLRRMALSVEHTWGTDTKRYLDHDHYKPADLNAVLGEPGYRTMDASWKEKRDDLGDGIGRLPAPMRAAMEQRLETLSVAAPSPIGMRPHPASRILDTAHYRIALDPRTGSIIALVNKNTQRAWASPKKPLALFTYQTLGPEAYDAFIAAYLTVKTWWGPQDFGKPNVAHFGVTTREWHPTLRQCWASETFEQHRLLAELAIDDPGGAAGGLIAWPASLYLEIVMPKNTPQLQIRFVSLGKQPNRLPEAMWLTFNPVTSDPQGWELEKVGQPVRPADVVRGGGRSMHAVSERVRYRDARGTFELATLDAPVVALGARSPLDFSLEPPTMQDGLHVGLYNNAWGTNYPQWCGGDWMYRINLTA
ncbi:MAG TPA: DUF5054 domain-containing protein [Acidobacteriaceae bacterium]|jgi:hypothetical protein